MAQEGRAVTLQSTIDAAAPGSTITLPQAVYPAVTVSKPLTIKGPATIAGVTVKADDVTLDSLTFADATYGIQSFGARTHSTNCTFQRLACAVELRGDSAIVEDFTVTQMDRMVTDDWGGTGFNFFGATNAIIRRGTLTNVRAANPRYGYDGGGFAFYAAAKHILIEDVTLTDCLNVMEDGIDLGTPVNEDITFRRVKAIGNPAKLLDQWWATDLFNAAIGSVVFMGFIVRATAGVTIEDCDLDDLDGWYFNFDHSGNHYGNVTGVNIAGNRIRLKAGDNRAYLVKAGFNAAALTLANDIQDAEFGTGSIAYKEDIKGNTSDLATFKAWLPGQVSDTWGPVVVTPPSDPCADLKAQILAVLNDKKKTQQQRITAIKALIA